MLLKTFAILLASAMVLQTYAYSQETINSNDRVQKHRSESTKYPVKSVESHPREMMGVAESSYSNIPRSGNGYGGKGGGVGGNGYGGNTRCGGQPGKGFGGSGGVQDGIGVDGQAYGCDGNNQPSSSSTPGNGYRTQERPANGAGYAGGTPGRGYGGRGGITNGAGYPGSSHGNGYGGRGGIANGAGYSGGGIPDKGYGGRGGIGYIGSSNPGVAVHSTPNRYGFNSNRQGGYGYRRRDPGLQNWLDSQELFKKALTGYDVPQIHTRYNPYSGHRNVGRNGYGQHAYGSRPAGNGYGEDGILVGGDGFGGNAY